MNRQSELNQILGPYGGNPISWPAGFEWRFDSYKRGTHSSRYASRKFTLQYDTVKRTFSATGTRRTSKKKKREPVKVSAGMVAYLRSRLSKADIARCIAASIIKKPDPLHHGVAFNPSTVTGWGSYGGGLMLSKKPFKSRVLT